MREQPSEVIQIDIDTEIAGDKWWEQVKVANCTQSLSDTLKVIDNEYLRAQRQLASAAC